MSLKQNQKEVDDWIKQYKVGYFEPFQNLARIIEEVGEVARELHHRFGLKKKKATEKEADLEEELGDVIYAVICLANSLNLDLDRAWRKVMKKVYSRDKDRWEKK
jgi:NTP pyrophosphatase (non-canonical NTP hydrolase)